MLLEVHLMSVLLVSSQARAADAAVESDPVLAHFRLTALVDPGMLPRILEHFAKRSVVPERLLARRAPHQEEGEILEVEAEVLMRDSDNAQYVGRCMAQIPGVLSCVVLTD